MSILEHYRCAPTLPGFEMAGKLKDPKGFFRFGSDLICYGQAAGEVSATADGPLVDLEKTVGRRNKNVVLPFDASQVLENLKYERHCEIATQLPKSWVKEIYYLIRPLMPVGFRKHLQKAYFRGWENLPFPAWPVDRSADMLSERLLVLAMQASGTTRVPFIWFWPEGHKACAIVTHDVETTAGRDFSGQLMDLNDAAGIKSSFQVVPEKRYEVPPEYLESIRSRGFEVNVHGLDHDGNLFEDRAGFLERARKINDYAAQYGARGFRSPAMYRNTDWLQDLNFSYDMSVPNVARLEPQRGGCCTVMPYVLPGGMTELPLTATQDYTLFHMLNDYSITLWKQQMGIIVEGHGLISFITHPDYLIPTRARDVYKELLVELGRLRSDKGVWMPLPGQVDQWWRARNAMKLVPAGQDWTIEGPSSDRATLAYACLDGDRLMYEFETPRNRRSNHETFA